MDSFELNKIMGAVLGTCLVLLTLNMTAGALFAPHAPEKPGYEIAVPEAPAAGEQPPAAQEVPIAQLMAKADAKRGEAAVKVCQTCHTFEKGGPNRVGPNLYGVLGGPKGHIPSFNYSAAMKKEAGAHWDYESLNAFLRNPRAALPGTTMGYAGVTRDSQRADIIAYINANSDKPLPAPQAAEAAPEGAQEAPKPQ